MLVKVVFEAERPEVLAGFWAPLLGFVPEFTPATGPKEGKNRIHLDLASRTPVHQAELVERALALGGARVDLGQGEVPWVVLADPEGNEFCVLEPRERYASTGPVAAIVVDAGDPERLAAFWSRTTGWPIRAREGNVLVGLRSPDGGPWLEFLRNDDEKRGRVHLSLAAGPRWRTAEDPEGNVFRVSPELRVPGER